MYELNPWEQHPDHPTTEVRCDDSGEAVLSLWPEGMTGSQCWAWQVETASRLPHKYGVNLGSDLDKETARRQSETAAEAYGYSLNNRVSDAPAIARRILNLPISEAAVLAQMAGVTVRIGSENGRGRALTDDRQRDRVTVTVMDGVVIAATPG